MTVSITKRHSWATAGFLSLAYLVGDALGQDDSSTNPCESYGVDFQNGGSYFQNASSMDPFTFASIFEGCQNDMCNNVLVDPAGDEYLCTDTNLTPDDTTQMSTCPIDKDQMYSGDWSVLLISNNGDAEPIAYERDFYLTVATPSTVTYTPTVTLSATITPITNVTSTQTSTTINTITSTIVSPAVTRQRTTTTTPQRVTVSQIITLGTFTKIRWTAVPTLTTKTVLETCSIPRRQRTVDPICTITPTIITAAALSTETSPPSSTPPVRRRDIARRVPSNREVRIAERKARLAGGVKDKRGLDVATTTVTDQNSLDYPVVTSYSTASTSTIYVTTQVTVTSTTISTTTTYSGTTNLPQFTITAPTPTKTQTKFTLITTTSTITKHPIVTVTIHTAPAASTSVCQAKGGKMV